MATGLVISVKPTKMQPKGTWEVGKVIGRQCWKQTSAAGEDVIGSKRRRRGLKVPAPTRVLESLRGVHLVNNQTGPDPELKTNRQINVHLDFPGYPSSSAAVPQSLLLIHKRHRSGAGGRCGAALRAAR